MKKQNGAVLLTESCRFRIERKPMEQKIFAVKTEELRGIVAPLLKWYPEHARILPWRENRDPYRVWISEIMLQQTRVEAVIPYYNRFLAALPDTAALAQVEDDLLLKLWEGLGYYTRARNLKRAAQMIETEFGGIFPADYETVSCLPGVGPYTAGAICSIAFGLPTPAVDGNVLRVLTRLFCCGADITQPALKKAVTSALKEVYPREQAGDFTQALMELGAVRCLPNGAPLCGECPLAQQCLANQKKTQENYPVRAAKKARKREEKTVFLLTCGRRTALRRRDEKGLLAGLWELPNTAGFLTPEQARKYLEKQGVRILKLQKRGRKTHVFTHVEWHMQLYTAVCDNQAEQFVWADEDSLGREYPIPTAFRIFMEI